MTTPQIPAELRLVPHASLEGYVLARLKQFSRVFASQIAPNVSDQQLEAVFQRSLSLLGSNQGGEETNSYALRFTHRCKFLGCMLKSCALCKNNPSKKCKEGDNFDEYYADKQVLRSKCEADVHVELVNQVTGQVQGLPGIEVQLSVIDGDSYAENDPLAHHVRELLKSDEGQPLLASHVTGIKVDSRGYLHLKLQDGSAKTPDVNIRDKNDTFRMREHSYSTFRLMARAVQRDLQGSAVVLDNVIPAVSAKFVVKTQRALNDYRKSEYPHYKDDLTKLKFIGNITAQRLKDVQAHLTPDVPFTCIETVEQLKHLMLYADQNRQVENKLLELLNMKGKHKHKWEYLREVLTDKIVYDDVTHRAWFCDDTMTQGLAFACKQAQVNFEKPLGLLYRVVQNGQSRLQVIAQPDSQGAEMLQLWRGMAEQAWGMPSHPGWTLVHEPMELHCGTGAPIILNSAPSAQMLPRMPSGLASPMNVMERVDDSLVPMLVRSSVDRSSPHAHSHAQSAGVPSQGSAELGSAGGPPSSSRRPSSIIGADAAQQAAAAAAAAASAVDFDFRPSMQRMSSSTATGMHGSSVLDPFRAVAMDPAATAHYQFGTLGQSTPMQHAPAQPFSADAVLGMPGGDMPLEIPLMQGLFSGTEMQAMDPMLVQAGNIRTRSGRYRRLSADTPGLALKAEARAQLAQLPASPGRQFMENLELSFKRSRNSAPGGSLLGEGELPEPNLEPNEPPVPAHVQRLRQAYYHQESRGRHLPRSRTSMENIYVGAQGGMDNMFDGAFEQMLANSIPDLQPPDAFVYKPVSLDAPQPYIQQQQQQVGLEGLDLMGPPAEPTTQHLSDTMESSLHIDDALLQAQQAQMNCLHDSTAMQHAAAAAQLIGRGGRVINHSDSDSFSKTLNRMLKHQDSDSFKRLLEPMISPSGGPHPDPNLSALDNILAQLNPSHR